MAPSRDDGLVARARGGEDAAFEELYARHQPAVLAFCRHLTGSREDAEDAVQHTFLAAYRQLVGSAEEIELRPWLYTVARNRCLSLLRARRDRPVAEHADAASAFDGLSAEVERRQELRDLLRDLARLPEPQRAALVLSQLDALSYAEIGVVLDVDPAKVKALVFQARSTLASTREARETPCLEIRREIATARGAGLRRRLLRRHVGQCDGCREFEVTVRRQRRDLGSLLPVPSAGLAAAVLGGGHEREAAAAAGAGGLTATGAGSGGGGLLAVLGGAGAAKLAVVAVVAGGGVAGAVAAEIPQRVVAGGQSTVSVDGVAGDPSGDAAPVSERPGADPGSDGQLRPTAGTRGGRDRAADGDSEDFGDNAVATAEAEVDSDSGAPPAEAEDDAQGQNPHQGLPPGLARRDELPPGLAKRDELPPGLAKRGDPAAKPHGPPAGGPPGQSGGNGNANPGGGAQPGGGGQGGGPPSSPPGNSGGNSGNGGGNGNAGGNGGGGGNGGQQGGGNGNGNGGPG